MLLGCIVERPSDERQRRLKVLYWVLIMAILGLYLGIGRRVPVITTAMVLRVLWEPDYSLECSNTSYNRDANAIAYEIPWAKRRGILRIG